MKSKIMSWKKVLCLSALLCCFISEVVVAAAPGEIISSNVTDKQAILYVQNPGEVEGIACQIGNNVIENIEYSSIAEQEVPVSTLFLIDNSLSVSKEYRPMIGEIMNNLVANRMNGEQFSVATFSDKVTCLLEDSSDYSQLKQTIDGIEYVDQETYLTDVLYEILSDAERNGKDCFRRIIVVSDGVDNKAIGYTKEELYDLIEEQSCPIYSLGCKSKNGTNNEALENMFAISRTTKAAYWLMDEVADSMAVVNEIAETNDVLRVEVDLPPSICDGTPKGVKMTIQKNGETKENSVVLNMPFSAVDVADEELMKAIEQPAVTEEAETKESISDKTNTVLKFLKGPVLIAVLAIAVIVGVVIFVIKMLQSKKENEKFEAAPKGAFDYAVESVKGANMSETEVLGDVNYDSGHTAIVWSDSKKNYLLVVTDLKNPIRRFEAPISDTVVIGRSREDGCQIILDYDKSVSRRHCQIRLNGNQLKVKDLGSRNKTFLEDKREVIGEVDISSGSVLKLGNVKVKVELRG